MDHHPNLQLIERDHLLAAAAEMDKTGGGPWSEYWIRVGEKEYHFKYLIRLAYQKATGIAIGTEAFPSNTAIRTFFADKFGYNVYFRIPDFIPFFNKEDFEFFRQYGGKPYRKDNPVHIDAGEKIKSTIFKKTNAWVRALNITGFDVKLDNKWQISGTFKPYSWARIFRTGDRSKQVFFTVGADSRGCIIYKLDCQRTNYGTNIALAPEQVAVFDRIVQPTGAHWKEIGMQNLADGYDWERLIETTRNFITHYMPLYDEVINAIFSNPPAPAPIVNQLVIVEVPAGLYTSIPEKRKRQAGDNPDYDAENQNKKKLGDAGEQLVLQWEKESLEQQGCGHLAQKVIKVLDWEGYDILSYHPDGTEKYIEVKTTTGSANRPFVLTVNEKRTMLEKSDNYYLYRLYDYDAGMNSALCFVLPGDFSDMVLEEPTQFNIYLKA